MSQSSNDTSKKLNVIYIVVTYIQMIFSLILIYKKYGLLEEKKQCLRMRKIPEKNVFHLSKILVKGYLSSFKKLISWPRPHNIKIHLAGFNKNCAVSVKLFVCDWYIERRYTTVFNYCTSFYSVISTT